MNAQDSSGFELLRDQRVTLIEYPTRDLRQWMIRVDGNLAGFVDQWGGGQFWALAAVAPKLAFANLEEALEAVVPPTLAFAHLEHAVAAVEFAKMVHDRCGVCEAVRQ
jgi:hypothetical protein